MNAQCGIITPSARSAVGQPPTDHLLGAAAGGWGSEGAAGGDWNSGGAAGGEWNSGGDGGADTAVGDNLNGMVDGEAKTNGDGGCRM